MDAADYEAAGLYDPGAPAAADRLATLEFLAEHGVSLDQMVLAQEGGSLCAAAGDMVIRPGERISLREVAAGAGMALDLAERVWRAVGFPAVDPDAPAFTKADVEAFTGFRLAAEMFGDVEGILSFTRVMGSSLAQIAETAVAGFLVSIEHPLVEGTAGELALARANLEATAALATVPNVMDALFRHHVEAAIRRFRQARAGLRGYAAARMAVGFVDLVGFTSASQRLPAAELATLVADFAARAFDVVAAHEGRPVKMIGDEVMFVAVEPVALCEIALTLCETLGGGREVTPRGGLAFGTLVTLGGDYYGPIVNLASRVADLAVPDELLVSRDLRDAVSKTDASGYRFDPAGRRMLKGFDEPVELCSLTRAG